MTEYDVARVRAHFPQLHSGPGGPGGPGGPSGPVRFDGPGGSLVPTPVAEAVAAAMLVGVCQRGSVTAYQQACDAMVTDARAAMGRFLATDPRGVVFGRSMTALAFDLARTLAQGWGPGDEVIVTRLDHDADIRPWVIAAERAGATVRWLGFDPATAELDDLDTVLTDRARLVAVTGASNLFGTRPDVAAITARAHEVGALVHVDAVHLAAHATVDRSALGADFLTCSPYKFFGPHLGVLAADPALLETLHPDKLLPSSEAVPERFELGTLPYELLAGVTAAVEFAEGLGMAAVEAHEDALLARLLDGLATLPRVTRHGRPAHLTSTVLINVDGLAGAEVEARLAELDIHAPASSFYALEASRHAGLGDTGGVRIGLAAYTSETDVDRLLAALAAL